MKRLTAMTSSSRRLGAWTAHALATIPRPSLGTWWALVFTSVAGLAVLAWWFTDALDDWAPNFAAEALSIAATIVIVERIVRHEDRERLRPRVESAMAALRQEFRKFLHAITVDYAGTHLHTFRPLPADALSFLDQWLADKDAQDACPTPIRDDDRVVFSLVLHEGIELGKGLVGWRELDRDVMEPEVVRAIDDYVWHGAQHGATMYQLGGLGSTRATAHTTAEKAVVRAARAFGEVLARYDPRGRIVLEDLTLSAMEEHSEMLRKRAGEITGWRWYPRQSQDMPAPGGEPNAPGASHDPAPL
jgi:hypothetical protein